MMCHQGRPLPMSTNLLIMDASHHSQSHKNYLIVTALVVGAFGPLFTLATQADTDFPATFTLDLLAWPLDGEQNFLAPTTRFLSALTGGFLTGWGVMIYLLQRFVYDQAPEGVRKAVVGGLVAWFVTDSIGSVMAGQASNVLFNILVLLLAVGPLWRAVKGEYLE